MNREQGLECEQMRDEESIVNEILERLPTPLQGKIDNDGSLHLQMPDGARHSFYFEVKAQPRKEWLMYWKSNFIKKNEGKYPLLLCHYLSPTLQKYCIENKLNFIDSAGNMFVLTPNYYLNIMGNKNEDAVKNTNGISIGIMKLLFVMLANDRVINYTYRDIAEQAGVSLGMVKKGFDYLESNKLYREGKNGRRFTDIPELYRSWIQAYDSVLRPKIVKMRLSGNIFWKDIKLRPGEYWTGEVAAYELSKGYLQPEMIKIFTPLPFHERRKDLGLRPDPNGDVEFMEAFWGASFQMSHAGYALLTIAELIASQDDRNIETAKIINEQSLHINPSII